MSTRLSNKPSKKDRPRSTDKNLRSKKRDGGTPDKLITPSGSAVAVPNETASGPPAGNVLSGDDIDSLAINLEELKKMRSPKPPGTPKTLSTVLVRKARLKTAESDEPVGKSVTVVRPAPADAALITDPLIGPTGPSYSQEGQPLTHTILGNWQDFHMEAIQRGDIENLPPFPPFQFSRGSSESSKVSEKIAFPQDIYQTALNESNALSNWKRQMAQRRAQQRNLSNLMNVRSDMLVMNQSEEFRKTQEQRHVIDRAIPSMDYGKGYRVGSEFWKQVEPIGNDETGLTMTLTQTERGYPPQVEHIAKPIVVKKEMGIEWSETNRNSTVHYPWHKSSFLKERKQELQDTIKELDPHQPYLDEIEVIGTSKPANTSKYAMETLEEEDEAIEDAASYTHDPLAMHADVFPAPFLGPSLTIGGKVASWTGSTTSGTGHVSFDQRVTFEGSTGDRVVSKLVICNDGTTAVYYSWKSIPKANTLGTRLAGRTQRFYFNTNSGVILPGETMNFPFIFKSPNAGIFSEQWELLTQPVLCGGAAIRITLRGVATEEDKYFEERQKIEEELAKREALETAKKILDGILDGVRTPERPSSPVDAYITQEEIFTRRNKGMYFNDEAVEELQCISSVLDEEAEWDLSIVDLKRRVMAIEDDEQREDLLQKLNAAVISLSFPPMTPIKQAMYSAGYQLLCELVDNMVNQSFIIRSVLGLPEREMVEDTSHEEEAKKVRKVISDTRADTKSKDKKDKKGGGKTEPERPNSQTLKRRTSASKKTGRSGNVTPTSLSKSVMSDGPGPDRSGTPASADGSVQESGDPIAEAKYRENIFTQMYGLVIDTFDRMEMMFEDIRNCELKAGANT